MAQDRVGIVEVLDVLVVVTGIFGDVPEFERISNEVWTLIEEDEALRPQLEEALRELGNS